MVGYKIYFDGYKFVVDDTATEAQSVPCDSTVIWLGNKKHADNIAKKFNANYLKEIKKCKECGKYFWQTDEKRMWFHIPIYKLSCRCYSCRKKY